MNNLDVEKERFHTLTGKYKHYCIEWDGMAIDEHAPEFEACLCYGVDKPKKRKESHGKDKVRP